MSQFRSSKKGFTLVELVIVIAILAILAAIAIPTVMNVIGRANESSDLANAKTMESALKTQAALDAPGSGTNYTVADAKKILSDGGINITKAARAGYQFYGMLGSDTTTATLKVQVTKTDPGAGWEVIVP